MKLIRVRKLHRREVNEDEEMVEIARVFCAECYNMYGDIQ